MRDGVYRCRPPRRLLDELIVEYVGQNPGATSLEVGYKFNITTKGADHYLSKLYRRGLLRRGDKARRGTKYLYTYYVEAIA